MFDHPFRPRHPASLFVGRAGEQDVATQARDRVAGGVAADRPGFAGQQPDDPEFHRHHRLHVHGAAAIDVAIGEVGGERVVAPALRWRGDDVEVREEEQRVAAAAIAVEADVDRAAPRLGFDHLRLEARRHEHRLDASRRHQLSVGRIRRRWVDRPDPDELADGLDKLLRGDGPGRLVDLMRRSDGAHQRGALPVAMVRAMPMTKPPNMSAATIATSNLP